MEQFGFHEQSGKAAGADGGLKKLTMRESAAGSCKIAGKREVLICLFLPFVALLIRDMLGTGPDPLLIKPGMMLLLMGLAAVAFYRLYKGRLTTEQILYIVMGAGIVMRVGYMLYTGWWERFYDVGNMTYGVDKGHASYIVNYILERHMLPESNEYQFYHPPLYHLLSALVIRAVAFLERTTDYPSLIQYAAVVSCQASCITLIFVQKLFDVIKIDRKYQILGMAILAFFPNWILMGGRVNNDALVTMFMIMAIYFTIKWYFDTKMSWAICIGLSIGLGMMTKVSCGMIAVFTGPIMLYRLFLAWKEKQFAQVFFQLLVFGAICFPLALWYPVRNYLAFGQSLNYVHDVGKNSRLYTGDRTLLERFFNAPVWEEFTKPFADMGEDYSIGMLVTRTAVFGEFSYENIPGYVTSGLYYSNILLIVLSLISGVYVCVRDKAASVCSRFSMAVLWLIYMGSFVILNISYPYSCSADTRYLPVAVLAGCGYLSMASKLADTSGGRAMRFLLACAKILTVVFCAFTVVMYV